MGGAPRWGWKEAGPLGRLVNFWGRGQHEGGAWGGASGRLAGRERYVDLRWLRGLPLRCDLLQVPASVLHTRLEGD